MGAKVDTEYELAVRALSALDGCHTEGEMISRSYGFAHTENIKKVCAVYARSKDYKSGAIVNLSGDPELVRVTPGPDGTENMYSVVALEGKVYRHAAELPGEYVLQKIVFHEFAGGPPKRKSCSGSELPSFEVL